MYPRERLDPTAHRKKVRPASRRSSLTNRPAAPLRDRTRRRRRHRGRRLFGPAARRDQADEECGGFRRHQSAGGMLQEGTRAPFGRDEALRPELRKANGSRGGEIVGHPRPDGAAAADAGRQRRGSGATPLLRQGAECTKFLCLIMSAEPSNSAPEVMPLDGAPS